MTGRPGIGSGIRTGRDCADACRLMATKGIIINRQARREGGSIDMDSSAQGEHHNSQKVASGVRDRESLKSYNRELSLRL